MTPISSRTIRALFLGASLVAMPAAYAEAAQSTATTQASPLDQKWAEQLDQLLGQRDSLVSMTKEQAIQYVKSIEYIGQQNKPLAAKVSDTLKSISTDKNLQDITRQVATTNVGMLAAVQKDLAPQSVAFLKDQLTDPVTAAAAAQGVYTIANKDRRDKTYAKDAFEALAKVAINFDDPQTINNLTAFPQAFGREYNAPLVGVFKSLAQNGSRALADNQVMRTIFGIVSRDPSLLQDGKDLMAASIDIANARNEPATARYSFAALQKLMAIEAGVQAPRP